MTNAYSVFSFKNTGLGKVNLVASEASVEVLTSPASTKTWPKGIIVWDGYPFTSVLIWTWTGVTDDLLEKNIR